MNVTVLRRVSCLKQAVAFLQHPNTPHADKIVTYRQAIPINSCVDGASRFAGSWYGICRTQTMGNAEQEISPLIFIIDDEAWTRHFLANILEDKGYRTKGVANTADGLAYMKEAAIDVILVDLTIEDLSGYDIIRKASESPSLPEVIVMTGEYRSDHAVRALETGAFDFLTKPLDSRRLHLTIQKALEHRRLKAEVMRLAHRPGGTISARVSTTNLAFYDAATGLPNRALFFDRLDQALKTRPNTPRSIALIVLTIREIRKISLTYGIAFSDMVLAAVARKMEERLYDRDTVARTGDNEISIIAGIDSSIQLSQLFEKILGVSAEDVVAEGRSHTVSFIGGAVIYPEDGGDPSGLYHDALTALDAREKRGEPGFDVYRPDIGRAIRNRLKTERLLAKALSANEYYVELQPYHRLADDGVQGGETLLRWRKSDGTVVSPVDFIPLLEANFGIIPVTEWIVHQIADVQSKLIEYGFIDKFISINVSPVHFTRDSASRRLADLIVDTCPDPSHIIVEITESTLLTDDTYFGAILDHLGRSGVSIAIDDFGTGYSSLAYLTRYPIDYLKIDRSFVRDADNRVEAATIVAAIISMAQQLGIAVIAEGAESESEMAFLRRYGCDIVQGYVYSKPLSIPHYFGYIEKNSPNNSTMLLTSTS